MSISVKPMLLAYRRGVSAKLEEAEEKVGELLSVEDATDYDLLDVTLDPILTRVAHERLKLEVIDELLEQI